MQTRARATPVRASPCGTGIANSAYCCVRLDISASLSFLRIVQCIRCAFEGRRPLAVSRACRRGERHLRHLLQRLGIWPAAHP